MFLSDAAHESNNVLAGSFNASLMLLRLGSNFYQLCRIGKVDLIMSRFQHGFRRRIVSSKLAVGIG